MAAPWRARRLVLGAACMFSLLLWASTVAHAQPVPRRRLCHKFARQADASAIRIICRRQDRCGGPNFTVPSAFVYSTLCLFRSDTSCEPLPDGLDSCEQWLQVINPEPQPCPDLCTQHARVPQQQQQPRPQLQMQVGQQPGPAAAPVRRLPAAVIKDSLHMGSVHEQHFIMPNLGYDFLDPGRPQGGGFQQLVEPDEEQQARALLQQQSSPTPAPVTSPTPQVLVLTASNAIPLDQAANLLPPADQVTPMQVQVITANEAAAQVAAYNLSGFSTSPAPSPPTAPSQVIVEFPPMWTAVEGKNTAWVLPVVFMFWGLIGVLVGYLAWVKRHDPLVYITLQEPLLTPAAAQGSTEQDVDGQGQIGEGGRRVQKGIDNDSDFMVDNPLASRGSVTSMEVTRLDGKAEPDRSSSEEPSNLIGERLHAMDADAAGVVTMPDGQTVGTRPYIAGAHPRSSITKGDGAVGGYMFGSGAEQAATAAAGAMVPTASLRQRVRRSNTGAATDDVEQGQVVASSGFAPWPRMSNTAIPTIPSGDTQPQTAGTATPMPAPAAHQEEHEHSFFGNLFRSISKSMSMSGRAVVPEDAPRKSNAGNAGHGVVVVSSSSTAAGDAAHRSLTSKLSRSFKVVPINEDGLQQQGLQPQRDATEPSGTATMAMANSRSARFGSAPTAAADAPVHSSFRVRTTHAGSAGAAPMRVTFAGVGGELKASAIEGEDLTVPDSQMPMPAPRLMSPRSLQVRAKPTVEVEEQQQLEPPGAIETELEQQAVGQRQVTPPNVHAPRMVTAVRVQSPRDMQHASGSTTPENGARPPVPHPHARPPTVEAQPRLGQAQAAVAAGNAAAAVMTAPTAPDVRLQVDPSPPPAPAPPPPPSGVAGLRPAGRPHTYAGTQPAKPPTSPGVPPRPVGGQADESAASRMGRSVSNVVGGAQQGAGDAGRRRVGSTPAAPPPAPPVPAPQPESSKEPSKQAW